jgi:hypothetical protein
VSRSSFLLLLFTVVSLTAAVGVDAGGLREGKAVWRYEAHECLLSLKDDYRGVHSEVERAPSELRFFIRDVVSNSRYLAADLKVEARMAARYVRRLVRGRTDRG